MFSHEDTLIIIIIIHVFAYGMGLWEAREITFHACQKQVKNATNQKLFNKIPIIF